MKKLNTLDQIVIELAIEDFNEGKLKLGEVKNVVKI